MKKLLTVTALALGLAFPAVAQTPPKAQAPAQDCTAMWKKADANSDGNLTEKELDKFRTVLTTVDANKDGKISQSEFTGSCQKGQLKNIQL
jgi:hypothetical protein